MHLIVLIVITQSLKCYINDTMLLSQDFSSFYRIIITFIWDLEILNFYGIHCILSCLNIKVNRFPSLNFNCILYELKCWICLFSFSLFNNLKTTLWMIMLDTVRTSEWESQNNFFLINLLLLRKKKKEVSVQLGVSVLQPETVTCSSTGFCEGAF